MDSNIKLWGDMTDVEKGALLLAEYNGQPIRMHLGCDFWHPKARAVRFADARPYRADTTQN